MHDVTGQLTHLRRAARIAGVDVGAVALPASKHTVVGGMRLHHLEWGRATAPPVVLLHGGGLTAHTWDLVCLGLLPEWRCLALDLRGHGDSEWSPAMHYDVDDHVGDVHGFLDQRGLRHVTLVGQSLGAFVALAYAARNPQRVRALVMVDSTPFMRWSPAVERVTDFVLAPPEADSLDELVGRAHRFNPRRDVRLLRRSLLHNLRRLPDGRWAWKHDRRHLSRERFVDLMRQFTALADATATVSCPVLVVRGAESESFTDELAAETAAAFPRARWVRVEGAGHTVQGDNAAGLVAVLRDFLRGAPAP